MLRVSTNSLVKSQGSVPEVNITNTYLISSFSAPPTNNVIFIAMKYHFFGGVAQETRIIFCPRFVHFQFPPKPTQSTLSISFQQEERLMPLGRSSTTKHSIRFGEGQSHMQRVSNDENQPHILWCPPIIIISIRPVMPRGKENLMALLHYPQKVTIIKILEKVNFRTGKKFYGHCF